MGGSLRRDGRREEGRWGEREVGRNDVDSIPSSAKTESGRLKALIIQLEVDTAKLY